jgi:hypothetical protein
MSNQFDKITIQQSDIEQQQSVIRRCWREIIQTESFCFVFFYLVVHSLAIFSIFPVNNKQEKKEEIRDNK